MDEKFCETDIYDLLYRLGVTANYTGFFHTAYAVSLCMRQPDRLLLVTKWLYPEVAKRYKTNWKAVERNIRTVSGIIWRENRFLLEQLAGKPLAQRPCTSQLLAILSSAIPAAYGLDEAAALMGECTGTGNRN
ncbi:MAG: sporulation protein [Oscillibacter sp.]|nr:sporulation protein [Oscillibacter sp.]